jgi:hypothetical protein
LLAKQGTSRPHAGESASHWLTALIQGRPCAPAHAVVIAGPNTLRLDVAEFHDLFT